MVILEEEKNVIWHKMHPIQKLYWEKKATWTPDNSFPKYNDLTNNNKKN